MKTRIITAAIAIAAVVGVIFFLPDWVVAAVFAIFCAVAARELIPGSFNFFIGATMAFAAVMPVFTVYLPFFILPAAFIYVTFAFVWIMFFSKKRSFSTVTTGFFGGIVIPYGICSLLRLYLLSPEKGGFLLLLPCISAWVCDSVALFVGRAIGHIKLAPEISPHKTVEGSIGGLAGSIAGVLLYGIVLKKVGFGPNFAIMIIAGFMAGIIGQIGDLCFSAIKRERGIKDFGNIFPGHGGVLDRVDSLIFVGMLFEIFVNFTYIINI